MIYRAPKTKHRISSRFARKKFCTRSNNGGSVSGLSKLEELHNTDLINEMLSQWPFIKGIPQTHSRVRELDSWNYTAASKKSIEFFIESNHICQQCLVCRLTAGSTVPRVETRIIKHLICLALFKGRFSSTPVPVGVRLLPLEFLPWIPATNYSFGISDQFTAVTMRCYIGKREEKPLCH